MVQVVLQEEHKDTCAKLLEMEQRQNARTVLVAKSCASQL